MSNLIMDVTDRILEKLAAGEPTAKNPYISDTNTRGQVVNQSGKFKFENRNKKDSGSSNWPVGGPDCNTWRDNTAPPKVQIGEMR